MQEVDARLACDASEGQLVNIVNHMFCTVFGHDKCLELSSYQGR